MGTDKQEEEDDGRVIADMSGIETPSLFAPFSGLLLSILAGVPVLKRRIAMPISFRLSVR